MANKTDKELNREFLGDIKNTHWKPVDPQPAPTRETLLADLREHLIAQTGSEALADLSISHLQSEADARVALERELRKDLAKVDSAIEAFGKETAKILVPLAARLTAAEAATASANAALVDARSLRDSELARGLQTKKLHIEAKLRGVEMIFGRSVPWRAGGDVPQFPADAR